MSILLAGLVLCHIPTFALSALYPRDNQLLQPVLIPLSLSNQQYVMNVAMVRPALLSPLVNFACSYTCLSLKSSGPQVQNLPFVLSTATGYTLVAGTSCDSCGSDVYVTNTSDPEKA